jgi:hypothetical protein
MSAIRPQISGQYSRWLFPRPPTLVTLEQGQAFAMDDESQLRNITLVYVTPAPIAQHD